MSRTGPAGHTDFFFFSIFIFNWRAVILQFCVACCHMTVRINHKYIYMCVCVYIYIISIYPLPLGPPSYPSCTLMFTATLFTIARTWKQPKCPSTDGWRCCGTCVQWTVTEPWNGRNVHQLNWGGWAYAYYTSWSFTYCSWIQFCRDVCAKSHNFLTETQKHNTLHSLMQGV